MTTDHAAVLRRMRSDLGIRLETMCRPDFERHEAIEEDAALAAALAAMEWQPIETAPRGLALLYFPAETGRNEKLEMFWVDFYPVRYPRKPTHWMPLPAPPEAAP